MDVEVKLAWNDENSREGRKFTASQPGLKKTTLPRLLRTLSEGHPELAPILENALDAPDLEIRVNDETVEGPQASLTLRDGDTLSLFIRRS